MSEHQHRAGSLKQQNKPFKSGKHLSKSQLKRKKGKISSQDSSSSSSSSSSSLKASSKSLSKFDRRNAKKQLMKQKRAELVQLQRSALDCPKILAIVSLGNVDVHSIHHSLRVAAAFANDETPDFTSPIIHVPQFKQRFLISETARTIESVLEVAKVADILLLALDANEETGVDETGRYLLTLIKAQGLAPVIGCIMNLDQIAEKNRKERKNELTRRFHFEFTDDAKLLPLQIQTQDQPTNHSDATQLLRFISSLTLKPLSWHQKRPYLVTQNLSFHQDETNTELGTLRIDGYLRGGGIAPEDIVHLPSIGDFHIKQIHELEDPYSFKRKKKVNKGSMDIENTDSSSSTTTSPTTLNTFTPKSENQESLEQENEPDMMQNEQNWDLSDAIEAKKMKKKVPKGTSEYQAAWILESDDEKGENEEEEEEENDNEKMKDVGQMEEDDKDKEADNEDNHDDEEDEEEEDEEVEVEEKNDKVQNELTEEEMEEALKKTKDAREDMEFPDEIDTPLNARDRLQKYRGLKSFRTSPWDPKENLPIEYARIFQFQNFTITRKRVLYSRFSLPVKTGSFIRLFIQNVPKKIQEIYKSMEQQKIPFIVSGLLKYERKVSVVNFLLQKHSSYEEPVQSKDPLIFQVGFRRFRVKPIYSQHNPNCDKHKYERFMHPGRTLVATAFIPVTFPPAPLLVFNDHKVGEVPKLVALGSILSVDPDRIILKKIILTAYPFKIRKRNCVAREMFYNPEDIRWFKPVELTTKYGRVGHITEPLGTHGLMKCTFDGRLKPEDTIMMNLYKRVYPPWRAEYQV